MVDFRVILKRTLLSARSLSNITFCSYLVDFRTFVPIHSVCLCHLFFYAGVCSFRKKSAKQKRWMKDSIRDIIHKGLFVCVCGAQQILLVYQLPPVSQDCKKLRHVKIVHWACWNVHWIFFLITMLVEIQHHLTANMHFMFDVPCLNTCVNTQIVDYTSSVDSVLGRTLSVFYFHLHRLSLLWHLTRTAAVPLWQITCVNTMHKNCINWVPLSSFLSFF